MAATEIIAEPLSTKIKSEPRRLSETEIDEIVSAAMRVKGLPAIISEKWVSHVAKQGRSVRHRLQPASLFLNKFGVHYRDATIGTYRIETDEQQEIIDRLIQTIRNLGDPEQFQRNILFYGGPGAGKDHLLYCLAMNAIFCHGHQVHWVNGSRLYASLWQSLTDRNIESVMQPLLKKQVLAISDPILTQDESKPFILDRLKDLIDERYRQNLPTWMTVNAEGEEDINKFFDETAGSRLMQNSIGFPCFWDNYRTTH